MEAFTICTPTQSLLGRAKFGWANGRGWGMGFGETEDAIGKDCHQQSQASYWKGRKARHPHKTSRGLWDMNLEPRGRREHRKTGPRSPGAARSCSEARAKPVSRPLLSVDLGHGPTAQEATSPATPARQARPGAPTCSVGCT